LLVGFEGSLRSHKRIRVEFLEPNVVASHIKIRGGGGEPLRGARRAPNYH